MVRAIGQKWGDTDPRGALLAMELSGAAIFSQGTERPNGEDFT